MTVNPFKEAVEHCKELEKLVREFAAAKQISYIALVQFGRIYLGIEGGLDGKNYDALIKRVDREFRYCCMGEFSYDLLIMENDEQIVYLQRCIMNEEINPIFLFAINPSKTREIKRDIIKFADKLSTLLKYL